MGWSDTARQAAAAEHGRAHAAQYAARRKTVSTLLALAAALTFLVATVKRAWSPQWTHTAATVGFSLLALAALLTVLLAGRWVWSRRTPYKVRLPRKYR